MAYLNESGLRTLWQKILAKTSAVLTSANSYTDEALEALKVGGRNLLLDTEQERSLTRESSNIWYLYDFVPELLEVDEDTFTFSVEAYGSVSNMRVDFYFRDSNANSISPQTGIYLTTNYAKYTWTFTFTNNKTIKDIADCCFRVRGGTGTVYFKRGKLERGDKTTDWSPAPEDINKQLEVGGRNLLRGTQYWDSTYWDISSNASIDGEILTLDGSALTSGYTEVWQKVNLTAGKTYTLSMDFVEQIASASDRKVNIFAYDMNSAVSGRTHNIINEDTPAIGKHSGTFTVPEGSSEFRIYIRAYSSAAFKIKNVQLEEGEKATAWEPAFEDLIEYTDEAIADITPSSIGAVSQADFNALEIGGRNMLLSSKDLPTTTSSSDIMAYQIGNTDQSRVVGDDGYAQLHWTLSGLTSSLWKAVYTPVYKLPDGWQERKVVLSAWIYADDWSTLDDGMYFSINLSTGNRTRTHYKAIQVLLANGALHATNGHGDTPTNGAWKRVWAICDLIESKLNGSGTFADNTHIYATFSVVTNGVLAIKQPKLEFGTRPTDWTPAVEDMDISIVPIEKGGTGATTTTTALTNLGAVNKAGDTMTGNLTINTSSYPSYNYKIGGLNKTQLISSASASDKAGGLVIRGFSADGSAYKDLTIKYAEEMRISANNMPVNNAYLKACSSSATVSAGSKIWLTTSITDSSLLETTIDGHRAVFTTSSGAITAIVYDGSEDRFLFYGLDVTVGSDGLSINIDSIRKIELDVGTASTLSCTSVTLGQIFMHTTVA